jgi:primosomal protein N' (replication factor Y) (superfamily II helicase)
MHNGTLPVPIGGGPPPAGTRPAKGATKPATTAAAGRRPERSPAPTAPVARVCVDVNLPHLDRPFDYLVPADLDEIAQPGVRVRVRFAGQLLDGILLDRVAESAHGGRLAYLEKVVSPERVLTPEVARLARAVADRYAGTLADVLRLALPPRHARAEKETGTGPGHPTAAAGDTTADGGITAGGGTADASDTASADARRWAAYPAGGAFLRALADGRDPRAVWTALPGEVWPARIAEAAAATRRSGRGVLVVVADARDLDRVDGALATALAEKDAPSTHVALSAALGPEQRYVRFLRALRGEAPVVAGIRAAAFAPVRDLGLVVIWDDGDDLYAEPRAPYPHTREVLLTRAHLAGAAVLIGGFGRTAEAQQLVESGWAKEIAAERETVRLRAPQVSAVADDGRDPQAATARMPSVAWRAARDALAAGAPVLVQVPRRGYLPAVTCAACRAPARCVHCHGPLSLRSATGPATCRWCARAAAGWTCVQCGGRALRAAVIGARRTAEELGRVFPDVPVRTSGRDGVLVSVPAEPSLVVSTPGAEPVVDGAAGHDGYGAVLLLDTWALLTRADLRAGEETLRRWLAAAALARPAERGGRVIVVADGALAPVQALVRFDPAWLAARDLAERRELGFPPAARIASLSGTPSAVAELLAVARLPDAAEVLGPVPAAEGEERYLVRVPRGDGRRLADSLHAAVGVRSARKSPDPVRIQIDPHELL